MWEKSNLKQFNIRLQHKTWNKWRGMNTFARHCVYIYILAIITLPGWWKGLPGFHNKTRPIPRENCGLGNTVTNSNLYNGHDCCRCMTTTVWSCLIWHGLPAALIVVRLSSVYTYPYKYNFIICVLFKNCSWEILCLLSPPTVRQNVCPCLLERLPPTTVSRSER